MEEDVNLVKKEEKQEVTENPIKNPEENKVVEPTNDKKGSQKTLIIIMLLLLVVAIGVGVYFLFIKKDDKKESNNGNGNNVVTPTPKPSSSNETTYKGKDNKEITLKQITNDPKNYGADPHTYELTDGDKTVIVYSSYEENKFVIFNDNSWYLLDKGKNEIISSYTSKNEVDYNRNGWDDSAEWYIVTDNEKIVKIVSEDYGEILSFTTNNPEDYIIKDDFVYLKNGNKVVKYDKNGKEIANKSYDKVLYFGRDRNDIDTCLIVVLNNKYYKVDIDDMKEEALSKKSTYSGKNTSIDLYLLTEADSDYYSNDTYMIDHKGKYYTTDLYDFDEDKNDYANIYYDRIEGRGQAYAGSFLVNKNTKEIVDYCAECGYDIYKVSNGYFFTKIATQYGDSPYDVVVTEKVMTSKGKTLTGDGMYSVAGNNIALQDKNTVNVYDVDGNVVKQYKATSLYLIFEKKALVKMDGKYYIINLETFNQKEIEITNDFNIDKAWVYGLDEKKIYFLKNAETDYDTSYNYDYINKKVSVNKTDDE